MGFPHADEAARPLSLGLLVKFSLLPQLTSPAACSPILLTIWPQSTAFHSLVLGQPPAVSLQTLADRVGGWADIPTSQTFSICPLILLLPLKPFFFFMSQTQITKVLSRAWRSLQVPQVRTHRKTGLNFENVVYCSFAHGPESICQPASALTTCQPSHQPLSLALWPLLAPLPAPAPLPALPHVPRELPEPSDVLQFGGKGLRWPLPWCHQ